MEHLTAIKVIEKLASDINLSQDPKGILIKYANDNNLTPAELERLGQVYNSAKTLSHLEKSANRGSTYNLLDIEDLVAVFTQHEDKTVVEKSASTIIRGGIVPNLFESETLEKSASNESSEFLVALNKKLEEQAVMEKRAFIYDLQNHANELRQDIVQRTNELVKNAFYKNVDTAELATTMMLDSAASKNGNKDALEFFLKQANTFNNSSVEVDFTKAATTKVTVDRTGNLRELDYIQEEIDLLDEIVNIQKSAARDLFSNVPKSTDLPETFGEEYVDDVPTEEPAEDTPVPTPAAPVAQREAQEYLPDSILAYLMAQKNSRGTEVPKQDSGSNNSEAVKTLKGIIDSKFDSLIAPHLKPSPKIRGYENAGVDKQISSVQTAATIHELMQDPIISAHSPQKVVSLYNSLAQINPAMMRDKNVSKFALREALQYEGITPHTYGQLIGIEKDKAQTEKQKLDIRKELYGKV